MQIIYPPLIFMSSEKGSRGEIGARAIQDSVSSNELPLLENKGGFAANDKFGSEMGVGTLFAKMDWKKGENGEMVFGFQAESDEEGAEESIVEVPGFPINAKIAEVDFSILESLPMINGGGGAFVIGEVDGKRQVVCMERWGMNSKEHRTAQGWVTDWDTNK